MKNLLIVCLLLLFAIPASAANLLRITDLSKTGTQEETIFNVLNFIDANMDAKCEAALPNVHPMIAALRGDGKDLDTVLIAHGAFSLSYVAAITGNDSSVIGLTPGVAMTVNDTGAFFVNDSRIIVGRYDAGTSQAKVQVLLHELGHFLHAPGFVDDFNDRAKIDRNDHIISSQCGAVLKAAKKAKL